MVSLCMSERKTVNLLSAVTAPKNRDVQVKRLPGSSKVVPVLNLTSPSWERQPYETLKAFDRFMLYRDMGQTRVKRQIAAEVGVGEDKIYDLAARWRWDERVRAWDDHLVDIKNKATEDAAKTMASRQAKLGMLLQDKATVALEQLAWDSDNPPTAKDVVSLADVGVKIERLARGEKTEDSGGITINLPVLPSWAKTSKYVTVADTEIKELPEAPDDNGKA